MSRTVLTYQGPEPTFIEPEHVKRSLEMMEKMLEILLQINQSFVLVPAETNLQAVHQEDYRVSKAD